MDEYLALEKAGDRRYEFWDGEIVCMSGGTLAQSQISRLMVFGGCLLVLHPRLELPIRGRVGQLGPRIV
jgi:hypothetical protein